MDKQTKITVTVSPKEVTLPFHGDQKFIAASNVDGLGIDWKCEGEGGGTVDQEGNYRAGVHVGVDRVIATTVPGVNQQGVGQGSDSAIVHVGNAAGESR